jgi:DMSO/TMAO reductase YedYZ heme-binding membrane subunit
MFLKKAGILILLSIIVLSVVIWLLVFPGSEEGFVSQLVMFFGLYGYLLLSVATMTAPFVKEAKKAFGASFTKVHHAFSILGLVFITLHPVFNAVDSLSLSVFVPNFTSWITFWTFAGRPAFIILYIAFFAAVLRRKVSKYWQLFHALTYIALLFGIVHANLLDDDFRTLGIVLIFDALFSASMASFAIKRLKNYRKKKAGAVASGTRNQHSPHTRFPRFSVS